MAKIVNISEIHPTLGFTEFDILEKYRIWYRDKGKKTIYHTGLATSLMMFLPAAAYLIAHIAGVTATDWLWCLVLFAVMCCVCVPLTETPLKKWVRKQEPGMFAFEDAKYYMRYGGNSKDDVEQSEARVD